MIIFVLKELYFDREYYLFDGGDHGKIFSEGCLHCTGYALGCFAHGPRSLKCRCKQKPIVCTPKDSYEQIMKCDNSNGQTSAQCTYTRVNNSI